MGKSTKVGNENYELEVDRQTGAVSRIFDKAARLELITEPRLAESFRLLLPLPDLEANYLHSTEQIPSAIGKTAQGLTIRWDGPLSNARGPFDIRVTVFIELVEETVQFQIVVENRTPYRLAEVWHAGLGGIMGLGERKDTRILIPKGGMSANANLFQVFPESMGVGGGGGMRFPEFYAEYPKSLSMPWMDIYNPRLARGMYYGCHDEVPRAKVLRFEMHPGLARKRLSGNWPTQAEIDRMGKAYPAGVVIHWVHLPYTPPGEIFQSPPVVFRCHAGDWHAGARIYRQWFLSRFPIREAKAGWLRQQQAVQDASFLLPEGNVMMTFKQIPQWAREAAEYGVKTVMVSGWNVGGHDNQYPRYVPDPRLGSWDDLAAAISACHGMGLRVLFFSNIQSVDTSTQWYEKELHQYRVMTAKGASGTGGWGMGTLGARMGYTCPPCWKCDPAFPAFRKIIVDQMRKLAEIGADGVHYDKVYGGCMDFNPDLGRGPDQAHFRGIIQCMEETLESCRKIRPDFCLGVESYWDRLLSYCGAWWFWCDSDHVPVMKFTFPEFLPTFAIVQPWDYGNANRAVQYGYQLLVGPARYSVSMADQQSQPISAYLKELIRIREELKDAIFFGDFLDNQEVDVEEAGQLTYKTHRNPATGKRACVLVNHGAKSLRTRMAFHRNKKGGVRIYQPFKPPTRRKMPATISIPGERLAIVVEE